MAKYKARKLAKQRQFVGFFLFLLVKQRLILCLYAKKIKCHIK